MRKSLLIKFIDWNYGAAEEEQKQTSKEPNEISTEHQAILRGRRDPLNSDIEQADEESTIQPFAEFQRHAKEGLLDRLCRSSGYVQQARKETKVQAIKEP